MGVSHKGAISLGLLYIPVALYTTTRDNDIRFNQLCKDTKERVKYKKYCPSCNKEVKTEEIIKRTKDWIKFKFLADEDFVICGYIIKEKGITSIILGQYKGRELIYKGHVTLGVRYKDLSICETLPSSPFAHTPPGNENAVWLKPKLVCVVEFMPNEKGMLRQPVFKGFRDDKDPLDCQVDTP
ncbi:MAG: 50S ribosomal protein L33 [Bacillota bacterium]|jgi:ribosomal protein L33|nr:50S ribosomal protein L33 [Bacillota bacterium]